MLGRFMAPARGSFASETALTTAGTHTFTVPDGVFLMEIAQWGAGGGGGPGGGGGGGAFYINDGTYYGDALGEDGANGQDNPNSGGDTTVTRDANGYVYSVPGGTGGYGGGYAGRGGNDTTGAAYLNNHDLNSPNFGSPFGTGATSVGVGGTGNWASGPDGQPGTDAVNDFDESADTYPDMARDGHGTPGTGGVTTAVSYEGHAYGKGGDGGGGGEGGQGYYGGDDTTDQGSPGASAGGGSSGGSGGLSIHTLSVSPGETFTVQVGAGGAQVSGGAGGNKAQDPISIGGSKQKDGFDGGVGAAGQAGAVVFRY